LKQIWPGAVGIAAGIGTIIGTMVALFGAKSRFRAWRRRRLELKAAPIKAIAEELAAQRITMESAMDQLQAIQQGQEKDSLMVRESMEKFRQDQAKQLRLLEETSDQVGTLQSVQLNEAYEVYCIRGSPLPMHKRVSLQRLYDQYTVGRKRNGVPEDFKEAIQRCHSA